MKLTKARLEFAHDGQVARIVLAAPRANILDRVMMSDVQAAFEELAPRRDLKAVVLTGDGPNFSYGASVQEHLPDQIAGTLERLHYLLLAVARAPAPTIAAVHGQCLGGGFELVLACDLVIAEENAQFGCPEIKLGVFPPAASALLPEKIRLGWASSMLLTGASWSGTTAAECGLVSRVTTSPGLDEELEKWLESDFIPRSAAALRHAARAIRQPLLRALEEDLPVLERMYLDELMAEPDAIEGIQAFLEKRQPQWGSQKLVG
jgi:cyclohexa-1,5-dienecarbonyl-CoA hydratase